MNRKEEFSKLFLDWRSSYIFSAHGPSDPNAKASYEKLKEWVKTNSAEGIQYIKEALEKGPNDLVMILQDLYGHEHLEIEEFIPREQLCNIWLNILNNSIKNGKLKDYYKDWRKWQKHLDKHYIHWNPFHESDPNVTFEEFKAGKRNKRK